MTAGAMRERAAILTYHSLDESGSVISTHPRIFARQMEALAVSSIRIVPLMEICQHPAAVAITFDDGFANFADHAVPVLERLSLPATVFVVSGYCGKRNNWPSQPSGLPDLPLMSWGALRDLPRNISLGAHTVTHPDLRSMGDREIREEVAASRMEIERQTGRMVETFAYPYGSVESRAAAVVRETFRWGCGTRLRFVECESDRAVLPRLDTYYLRSPAWYTRPFSLRNRMYVGFRRCLREARYCRSS